MSDTQEKIRKRIEKIVPELSGITAPEVAAAFITQSEIVSDTLEEIIARLTKLEASHAPDALAGLWP